ncbi:MAG: diol dehydratase small subunit [Anaerolineae bacterium]
MEDNHSRITTQSGRSLDELTMKAVLRGELTAEDFHISAETLREQAAVARKAGNPQFADTLERAAEITEISNEEVLDIYETLRPGRTSYEELIRLADRLETELAAPKTADLVREAAEAYLARGLIEK